MICKHCGEEIVERLHGYVIVNGEYAGWEFLDYVCYDNNDNNHEPSKNSIIEDILKEL